jgi:hypothetical protein
MDARIKSDQVRSSPGMTGAFCGARREVLRTLILDSIFKQPRSSLRANGSRECAPDDRLREAIYQAAKKEWIASLRSQRRCPNFKRVFAISRRCAPELCMNLPPPRGRGECRVPAAPAASRALGIGRTHTSNNEYTGIARHSRTQWFYGLCRALLGDRALLPPSFADMFCLSPVGPT